MTDGNLDDDDKLCRGFFLQNTIILYVIGAVAAIARIIIRWWVMRGLGREEVLMLFALLCWTGDSLLIGVTVSNGTNQIPADQREHLPAEEAQERIIGSKAFLGAWFLYVTAIWACKSAILSFYKRLTGRIIDRRITQCACITLMITYIASILSLCLICRPFAGNWTIYPDPGPACTDGLYYVWIVGVLNIVTDIMLLCIPLPLLITLQQVTLLRKMQLTALFGLGVFVVVATILRIYFTVKGSDISNMTYWSMIETATMFVVSNAPGIKSGFSCDRRKNASSGNPHSFELKNSGSKTLNGLTTHALAHTGTGESQECIVDIENPMAIDQREGTTIAVIVETSNISTKEGSCTGERNMDLQP